MASTTQDFMDLNLFPLDGTVDMWTETYLYVDPTFLNVQSQPTFALFPGTLTEAFFPQVPYEAPHAMAQDPTFQTSYGAMPPATAGPFVNSIHKTHPSGDCHARVSTAPQSVQQPLWSPPPTHRLVKVPQRVYEVRRQWNSGQPGSISFSVNGFPGINVQSVLGSNFAGLDGRDDLIFQNQNVGPAISCRFLFPGYPKNPSAQMSTLSWKRNRTSITRSKLAYELAKKLKQYLDSMTGHPIESSTDRCWEIGEGYMRFENMFLVSLASVSKGSFQPEIWVAV